MSRPDSGYATVTVTALMLGLSVLAVAWMDKSLAASKSADRLSAQILSDLYVEGALNEALGILINSRGMQETSLQDMHFSSREHDAIVSIVPMRNLLDLNSASLDEIEARLDEADLTVLQRRNVLRRIELRRDEDKSGPLLSLQDLGNEPEFTSLLPCLEQDFTVFHDPSPPVRRGESTKLGEGNLVRIRALAPGEAGAINAIILITGLRDEPYWIYDWKHTSERDHATC